MAINLNWDLDSIFEGGSQSQALADFLERLTTELDHFEQSGLPEPLSPETEAVWVEMIQNLYGLDARLTEAGAFVGCLVSQNVKDDKALQLMAQIDRLRARLSTLWTQLTAFFAQQEAGA